MVRTAQTSIVSSLSTIRPECGTAAGTTALEMAMASFRRTGNLPDASLSRWVAALKAATGEVAPVDSEIGRQLVMLVHVMFDDTTFVPAVSDRLVSRLDTVRTAELDRWASAFQAFSAGPVSRLDAALMVACIDRLFPGERYSATAGVLIRRRLAIVPETAVRRLVSQNGNFKQVRKDFRDDAVNAAVSISLQDALFEGSRFSQEEFDRALARSR
jgi:hypothetical protein